MARDNNYNGLKQDIDGATLNHSSYIGKVFLKAEGDQDQTFEMMVNWRLKSGGNTYRKIETKLYDIHYLDFVVISSYRQLGSLTLSPGNWGELSFSIDDSENSFADYDLRFYIQSQLPDQPYVVDEIYLVEKSILYPPLEGVIRDGDFELFRFGDSNGPWLGCNVHLYDAGQFDICVFFVHFKKGGQRWHTGIY